MVVLEKETQKFYAVDFETENMTKLWACLGVLRTESLDRKCGRQMSLHCQDTEKKKKITTFGLHSFKMHSVMTQFEKFYCYPVYALETRNNS